MKKWSIVGLLGLLISMSLQAQGTDKIKQRLEIILPSGTQAESINKTVIPNVYEVVLNDRVLYITADGRYLISGELLDLEKRVNITEQGQQVRRKKLLDSIDESQMIIFSPKQVKHTITVFTDIDCGYCRKLHKEIGNYLKQGIRVRYLSFPRAGIGSESYKKAVAVWCSKDRKQALTDAKAGKTINSPNCNAPIKEHLKLGERFGVRGTPAMVLESGEMIPGYIPADKLAARLAK